MDNKFCLDLEDLFELQAYLVKRGFAEPAEAIAAERAGEGNMNRVIRVRMSNRSLILKQAFPWVEKYPSIAAPIERAASEARFYHFVSQSPPVAEMMPRLLDFDQIAAVLILEDLSPAQPLLDCYQGTRLFNRSQLTELARFTSTLHGLPVAPSERVGFQNQAMRELNHEHIFDLPLRSDRTLSNMLEQVTPGLDHLGDSLRTNQKYCDAVRKLGSVYLEEQGASLIHGDLFPGSLLLLSDGKLRVIDPEFSFCGPPEFDLGIFYAHLLISGHNEDTASFWLKVAQPSAPYSATLAVQYAGVEIMRRLLGVAQLPISLPLETKRALLERSRELVLGGSS